MRIFLTIALLSWVCSPLFAKTPRSQIELVCVDAKGDVSFIRKSDGELELDQTLFGQVEAKWQADRAQQEISAKKAEEINERNRIEYERLVSEAKANYEKKWLEDHRDEIGIYFYSRKIGGAVVALGGIVGSIFTFLISIKQGLCCEAIGSTLFVAGASYGVWYAHQQIIPETMTPPPFKGLGWHPAEVGYAAIERRPESSERRFQVFVPFSSVNYDGECAEDRVLKAQDPADGYLYPVHFKY